MEFGIVLYSSSLAALILVLSFIIFVSVLIKKINEFLPFNPE